MHVSSHNPFHSSPYSISPDVYPKGLVFFRTHIIFILHCDIIKTNKSITHVNKNSFLVTKKSIQNTSQQAIWYLKNCTWRRKEKGTKVEKFAHVIAMSEIKNTPDKERFSSAVVSLRVKLMLFACYQCALRLMTFISSFYSHWKIFLNFVHVWCSKCDENFYLASECCCDF